MKFSTLMERAKGRGVVASEISAGGDPEILGVCEDSRKAKTGDLFVARAGTKTSGEKFVAEAVGRGAVAVIVGDDERGTIKDERAGGNGKRETRNAKPGEVAYAGVGDVNLACAILAHEVVGNPTTGMKLIGITGTKGKTTVAYLMRSVLKTAGIKVGMIGTVEIDDGAAVVPAEMTTPGVVELVEMFGRMRANGVTHVVMEVSSHALHQKRVAGIDFAVGIFTNLTGDHLDYHKTMEEYAAAKAILFEGLTEGAVAVVNGDDKWAEKIVAACKADVVRYHVIVDSNKYGTLETAPRDANGWSGIVTRMDADGMLINIGGPKVRVPNLSKEIPYMLQLPTPLVGRHNAYNLTSVFAAAYALGLRDTQYWHGVRSLLYAKGAPGRLQRVKSGGGFGVFVDYAHTHDALENVLTALRATMRVDLRGPSASGMLLTQDGERELGVGMNDLQVTGDPSLRQKHGTRAESESAADDRGGSKVPADEHAQGPFPEHGTREGLPDGRGSDGEGRLICVFGCGGDRDRTKRPKMGAVAERLADVVIVTSDNPRTEDAGAILEEICAGFSGDVRERLKTRGMADEGAGTTVGTSGGQDARVTVEPDRRLAIRRAIGMAKKGDVVLIAGKGHENYQIIGTTKHHFDDVEEAEAALREIEMNHEGAKTRRNS